MHVSYNDVILIQCIIKSLQSQIFTGSMMTLHHAAFDDVFPFSANQLHGCNEEFVLITTHSNFSESALSRSIELAYARTDVTYAMTLCSGDVCDTTKWLRKNCSVEVAKEMMTSLRLPVTKYLRHHRSDNRSSIT